MKTDYATNASNSAATSASRPNPSNDPETDQKAAALSESEYLAQQAHNAQIAMSRAWQELKAKLGQGADPTAWAKEHPWIAVSAAAAAGFVATAALVPSKEEQALKKLAAIERALNPADHAKSNGNGSHEKPGLMASILKEVIGLLKPVIASVIAANVGGGPPAPDSPVAPTARAPEEQAGSGV